MTDLYTRFAAGVLFPLQERVKKHSTVAVRAALEESQWWSAGRIEAFQLERLRILLSTAGTDVPYYRQLFARHGFDPAAVASVTDLARLPLLDKTLIRANVEEIKSVRARPLARFNTGGSSGEPLVFFIGIERVSHDVAAKWRATRWWGVDIGDPEMVVWGSPIELGTQDRIRAWRDRLFRTRLLPAFEMSESKLDTFVDQIRAMRPRMLFGYPSSISLIAQHAQKRGRRLDDLGVRVVFVTSERLYDHQRATISQAFGCPVANGYGGRDAGFLAHECPEGGMHITAEDVVLEIVDGEGHPLPAGQSGEIVVTHLATSDFPFIRYRTGDVGALDVRPCPCGRGLPLLKEVQGRSTDFVIAADGTVMHGLALIYVLRELTTVRSFKIIQNTRTDLEVMVVPGDGFSRDDERHIRQGIGRRMGASVNVDVRVVDEILPEKSGKFRYVVSRVAA